MANDASLFNTETATINVLSQPLVATIQGPQTIGSAGTLVLDGSKSVDPDGESGTAVYRWEVRNADNSAVIVRSKPVTILSDSTATINVANTLASGRDYIFTLTFRKGSRTATATQTVTIVRGDPPKVVFTPIEGRINPSDKVILEALITSSTPGNYSWSNVDIDGSGLYHFYGV